MRHSMRGAAAAVLAAVMCVTAPLSVFADEIIGHIHTRFNEYSANDWCYTNSNAMIVTMALLCGGGDFGTSVCLAVQSCFDTDCNGATVGSIVGIRSGEAAIDPYWYAPFEKRLYTSI